MKIWAVPLFGTLLTLSLLTQQPAARPAPAPNGDWKFEAIHLKTGSVFQGLVVNETPAEVEFRVVKQKPGRPTISFFTRFSRAEVQKVVKLAGKERDELIARVNGLDPTGQVEDLRTKSLELSPARLEALGKEGLCYNSDYFVLISDAGEDVIRRAAVRLEQVYTAYTRYFPPTGRPTKPNRTTTIILVQSRAEYQAMLRKQGRDIFNPAFYDVEENKIVCASELQELARQLAELRRKHGELLSRLKQQAIDVAKLPKGEVQKRALDQIAEARKEIGRANNTNEELFRVATQQLFQTLYHEAFHAYLANFVFLPSRGDVPRWLNEGLAQVFETAMIEAGELRVGHVPPGRLEKAQAGVNKGELVPLAELVRSGPAQFVVFPGQDRQNADRHYLTSWALAHYLMFERKVLGTPALEDYLTVLNGRIDPKTGTRQRGADPAEALSKLAGLPLPQLEKDWHQYILRLQSDGTTKK